MKEIGTDRFIFENEIYEIKQYKTASNDYKVVLYKNGQRANPFNYKVGSDYTTYYKEDAFDKLLQIAKNDIIDGFVFGKRL
ncbi:MAG: hypothetical protein HXX18_14120 [Bacteroidetes bacterium]|nr:hypothetical protein [Bacteroidota bacterium]